MNFSEYGVNELYQYYRSFDTTQITDVNDQQIEAAIQDLQERLQATDSRERWYMAIIEKDRGMLLLAATEQARPSHVIYYKTPKCGGDPAQNANALGTARILTILGVDPAFIVYNRLCISMPSSGPPECQPY